MFPPVRAMLATKPLRTGSGMDTNTTGTVRVVWDRAATTGVVWPTIRSGCISTSSLAKCLSIPIAEACRAARAAFAVRQAALGEEGHRHILRFVWLHLLHEARSCAHVLDRRHMREQIEQLEDHARSRPESSELLVVRQFRAGVVDRLITYPHATAVRLLEQIDATQERVASGVTICELNFATVSAKPMSTPMRRTRSACFPPAPP